MTRATPRRDRGAMSTKAVYIVGGAILVLAAAVAGYTWLSREGEKAEQFGRTGLQSRVKLGRHRGVNLPIAEKAEGGESSPETTVEVPLEWGKDLAQAETKLAGRYAEVTSGLTKPLEQITYTETVTLQVDRDLTYRSLVQAVLEGRRAGFLNFHIACRPKATEEAVGYLTIELPTDLPKVLVFRMVLEGESITYVLGTSKPVTRRTLKAAMDLLEQAHGVRPDAVVEVMPSLDLSVQNVVEGLNAVKAAGFERMTLSRPPKLY